MLERFKVPAEDQVLVREEKMRSATEAIFSKMGLSDEDAQLSADVLIHSDLRGCETHGVSNMLRKYVQAYGEGKSNPRPNLRVLRESSTTATLDADGGLGLHTAPKAMEIAIEKADRHGMGAVSVRNTGHCGMLAYHAMMPLKHDMIGVCMSGGGYSGGHHGMLPTFGSEPRFGTNPIAWAAPAGKMPPFVFDIATTAVAGNKLSLAERVGAKIEPGWLARPDGTPIMEEVDLPPSGEFHMLPFGGTRENGSHKGYGMACIIYIMSNPLAGTGWNMPGGGGHHFTAYKIDAFVDVNKFKSDMDDFLEGLANTKPAPGHDRVIYAGLPEHEETLERQANGIPYHKEVLEWFSSIASELEIDVQLR